MPSELRVHLAGRLSASYGEQAVGVESFRGRQGRIAFAYLATKHDHAVPRPELAEILWGDALPKSWESDLSAIVSRLRGVLTKLGLDGTRAISTALGCHELRVADGTVWTDIEAAARSLEEAEVALRSGDAGGCVSAATVAREIARRTLLPGNESPWLDRTRDELRQLHLRALAALGEGWSLKGELAPAIEAAQHEIEIDPFAEPAYRRSMRFHAAAGNRPEALRAWERCKTLLAEELGIDPSPETEAVYLEILRTEPAAVVARPSALDRGTVTLLFTDLVGSSELLALGDEGAEAVRRAHFALLRDAVTTRGGEEVKSLGDGLMVAFASVRDALGCAVAMQQAVERHNRRANNPLAVRIGLHVGEPIRDERDYFGSAVVIARRLCDDADGGQILASDLVRALAGPQGFVFREAGERTLKGLPGSQITYEVVWESVPGERTGLPAPLRPPADPPFVGREREVAWLDERLDRSSKGRFHVALVPGDPGIGKTRLVSEFASGAHARGCAVLYGRCDEEALSAYQPFVEAIDRYASDASLDDVRRHAGRGAPDIARVVPAFAHRFPDLPSPITGEASSERFRLFDAITVLLSNVAEDAPVVCVLEDVHWADRPTLLLLRHIARHAPRSPILVVATVRDIEVTKHHPLSDVVDDLRSDDALEALELSGLDDAATRDLVEQIAGRSDGDLLREVFRVTEGNPLFVRELARHFAEAPVTIALGVPESIKSVIGRRIDRLGDEALRVLTRAAVVGRDFDLDILVAIADATEEAALEPLEAAAEARVVDEVAGAVDRYSFSHALIRETLYERMTSSRRMRLHRRAAEAIEILRHRDLDPYAGELAYHYAGSGEAMSDKTYEYAVRAARYATSRLAHEDAAAQLERALLAVTAGGTDDPDARITCLTELGNARRRSGDHEAASRSYLEAIEECRYLARSECFARAALGLTSSWMETGVVDTTRVELLEEALAGLGDGEIALRAQLLGRIAADLVHDTAAVARRQQLSDEAVALARRCGDPRALALALHDRNMATWGPDSARDLIEAGREIVELADECKDPELALRGVNWQEVAHLQLAEVEEADRAFAEYVRLAEEIRQPRYLWYAETRRARRAIDAGNLAEGERIARRAYELGVNAGESDATHVYHGQMVMVWPETEDLKGLDTLRETHRWVEDHLADRPENSTLLWWRLQMMQIDVRYGDVRDAQAEVARLSANDFAAIPWDFHWMEVTSKAAALSASLGDVGAARAAYDRLAPYAGHISSAGGTLIHSAVDEILGLLARAIGRTDDAIAHLESALELFERIGCPGYAARTRHALAGALRERGTGDDIARSADLDARASSEAESLGMKRLAREIAG